VSVFNKSTRRVLSYDVLQQQKRRYDQGVVSRRFDLRLRRITSSPSQTIRRRLVRTTDAAVCSTLAPFVAALFLTLRDSYG